MSFCLLVSGCRDFLCVLHRWQREGRENWRGWWRELSEAPAALRQGDLSVGICTTPHPPSTIATATSPASAKTWQGPTAEHSCWQITPFDLRHAASPAASFLVCPSGQLFWPIVGVNAGLCLHLGVEQTEKLTERVYVRWEVVSLLGCWSYQSILFFVLLSS